MPIWQLLDEFVPHAGTLYHPFRQFQSFFQTNMGDGDSDPLAILRLALSGIKKHQGLSLPSGSLEFALRLAKEQVVGGAIIGAPSPGPDMASSIMRQGQLLAQLCHGFPVADISKQERLFNAFFPNPGTFNWLDASARALFFGVAYQTGNDIPIIKPYYTNNLDNSRSPEEVLLAALDALDLSRYSAVAVAFDRCCRPFSTHCGLGLDLIPGKDPRVKIYQRITWSGWDSLSLFAQEFAVSFSSDLWAAVKQFCPSGQSGLCRDFEVALVLGEPLQFKCNFFFNENYGPVYARSFLADLGFDTDLFDSLVERSIRQRYCLNGLAMSMNKPQVQTVNLYFMR